jgi:DNA anti-recombination protein RmuC
MNALYLLYDALIGIHVPNDRARAVVNALEQDMSQSLATKTDLQALSVATKADLLAQTSILRAELKAQSTELRADMQTLATELRSEMKAQATELRSEMKTQAAELRAEIQQLRHYIDDKLHRLTLTLATLMVTIMTAGIGLLVTLQRLH